MNRFLKINAIMLGILLLTLSLSHDSVTAQGQPISLRVEAATTGELSSAAPELQYTFFAQESLRMAAVVDKTAGDMQLTVTVFDQDGTTPLATASGSAVNGLVFEVPSEGQYFLSVSGQGTAASFRLMIDADPALPINAFVLQSYIVRGKSTVCAENTIVSVLTPTEDVNVCFVLDLVTDPVDITVQWWSPSGEMVVEEAGTADSSDSRGDPFLSGIVFAEGSPWEEGWWQAHILINDELAHIQWVPVAAQ